MVADRAEEGSQSLLGAAPELVANWAAAHVMSAKMFCQYTLRYQEPQALSGDHFHISVEHPAMLGGPHSIC